MSEPAMIEVKDLTKQYPGRVGIHSISFSVGKGEIVGLLGPNGAGKSTTMRILSCFLPADSGTARIAGLDVFADSDDVRCRIGYMPENNPLYPEMRVRDYLKFRGRLKGLHGKKLRDRVEAVVQQCGLPEVHRKIIGHLSKGFRQRVGLADALVNAPDVIILDEPTIGLDPNQIRSLRQLIRELGKETTILVSTHILSEVEMTCSRVVIMNQGRVLAADTTENLRRQLGGGVVVCEVAAPRAELEEAWDSHPGVEEAEIAATEGEFHRCTLMAKDGLDLRTEVFSLACARGWKIRELTRTQSSLEDIFVRVTKPKGEEETA